MPKQKVFAWRFTLPLYLGSMLNPINSSLIATALVPIALDLHVSVGSVAALVAAVYITSAVAQPAAGKLAEVFGPRRVFLTGTLCILGAGIIGGWGHDLGTLIAARVLVGIGSSAAYPSAMVLVRLRAAEAGLGEVPGGVLGGLAVAGMAVAALGLPLGGLLVGAGGWRSTFLVNIPLAAITFVAALVGLPTDGIKTNGKSPKTLLTQIDLLGIVLFATTITSLLAFFLSLPQANWTALAVFGVAGTALAIVEVKAETPFIDFRLLARNGPLMRTYLRVALTSLVIYGVMYGVSQWLEQVRGFSPALTGFLLLPMTLLAPLVSFPVSQRNLVRGPLIVTGIALAAGSIGVLMFSEGTSALFIAAVMLAFGLVMGLFTVANQTALYTQAPPKTIGTAAGLFRTFAYLGSIGSSAITGVVFRSKVDDQGLWIMSWLFVFASLAVLALSLADRTLRASRSNESAISS